MIRYGPDMYLNDQRQEVLHDASPLFGLLANETSIQKCSIHSSYIPPHWHREMEVFFLLEGSVRISVGEGLYVLRKGEGCFINSGALHSFQFSEKPGWFRSLVFDPGIVAGAPGSLFDTGYIRPLLEDGPAFLSFGQASEDVEFFKAFEEAFHLCKEEPEGYEFAVRWALSRIALLTKQKGGVLSSRKVTADAEDRMKIMLRWIEEHLGEAVTTKEIARQGNICPRACQKAFQRYLHCSPTEYLQRRRIFAAAQQLSFTNTPVTEIAMECGFSSPSYFTKCFKAEIGSSPTAYRAAAKK